MNFKKKVSRTAPAKDTAPAATSGQSASTPDTSSAPDGPSANLGGTSETAPEERADSKVSGVTLKPAAPVTVTATRQGGASWFIPAQRASGFGSK